MKLAVLMILFLPTELLCQTNNTVSGVLKNAAGAPIAKATVSAVSQTKVTGGKFPPVYNVLSQSDGTFSFDGLPAGPYVLCAERPDIALLNPCFWASVDTTLTVPSAGNVSGVSLVAEEGVPITIRLNDLTALFASSPQSDDTLIGTTPPRGPQILAQSSTKDSAGKTLTVFAQKGKPIDIHCYSNKLSIKDTLGNPFQTANFKVTLTAPTVASATPDLVLNITGISSGKSQ